MIRGIGVDMVQRRRIAEAHERFGERLAQRLLAPAEREALARAADPVAFLSKRFAAKEAAAKALGVGIGAEAGLRDIRVERGARGAPVLSFSGRAAHTAERLGVRTAHLSLSDEHDHALAFVVLEGE